MNNIFNTNCLKKACCNADLKLEQALLIDNNWLFSTIMGCNEEYVSKSIASKLYEEITQNIYENASYEKNNVYWNDFFKNLNSTDSDTFELILYSKTSMGNGTQANNPWLQEMPDPLTRVSWDNYVTVSKSDAKSLGLKNINDSNGALNSNHAKISIDGKSLKAKVDPSFKVAVSVYISPEQKTGLNGLL